MVMNTLNMFCEASGLKINTDKSRAMCSPGMTRHRRNNLTNIFVIRFTSDLGCYLGFRLVQGRVSKATFSDILEKT